MNTSAYGVVLERIINERNTFLLIISKLLMQLRDKVAASEAYAIHQVIKAVKKWADMGDLSPKNDRLRKLIRFAIDNAYREHP